MLERLVKNSRFYLLLKLEQISYIFSDNVRILYIYFFRQCTYIIYIYFATMYEYYIYQMHYPLRSQCSCTDMVYKLYLFLKFTVPYKKRRYLNKCSQCDYIENVNVKPSE